MWWIVLIIVLAGIIGMVVTLQRRGSTGIPGYQPKAGNDEQLGTPPGLGGGDPGGGF